MSALLYLLFLVCLVPIHCSATLVRWQISEFQAGLFSVRGLFAAVRVRLLKQSSPDTEKWRHKPLSHKKTGREIPVSPWPIGN